MSVIMLVHVSARLELHIGASVLKQKVLPFSEIEHRFLGLHACSLVTIPTYLALRQLFYLDGFRLVALTTCNESHRD